MCALPAYVPGVAYPKKKPEEVAKSAGISLPADLKAKASARAALEERSLSAVVRVLLKQWLEKTSQGLEQSGQRNLRLAKDSVKKRR